MRADESTRVLRRNSQRLLETAEDVAVIAAVQKVAFGFRWTLWTRRCGLAQRWRQAESWGRRYGRRDERTNKIRAEIRTDGCNSRPVCRRRVEWGPITAGADANERLDGRKIDAREVLVDANAGNTRTSKENESRSCPDSDPEPSGVAAIPGSGDRLLVGARWHRESRPSRRARLCPRNNEAGFEKRFDLRPCSG